MAATFPSGVKSFSTKSASQTIASAHINDIQEEVVAVETLLLSGPIPSALATLINGIVYPIGAIFTAGVATNPATLLGVGTWTAIAGRVIVGIDSGQTEFDTLDETGGSKTHALITAELAAHTHVQYVSGSGGASTAAERTTDRNLATTAATGDVTGSTGSGTAHNNLQPYIVKYVWQRTA